MHLTTHNWYPSEGDEASIVAAFEVGAGSWSEESTTYSSMPDLGNQIGPDTYAVTGAAPTELTFDVTSAWEESTNLDFYVAMTNVGSGTGLFKPHSRESDYAPYLEINYSSGGEAVPEPGTLALVGLGLGGLILKRRRED